MQNFKHSLFALLFAVVLMSGTEIVSAQESSVNAYSPYTMYGVGELGVMGNAVNRAMGGVGVAWRSSQMVSILNPAGYSATMPKSFILDISAEGNFLRNDQNKYDANGNYLRRSSSPMNSINVREVAVQFPITKGLGMGISLMPYGSVGYNVLTYEQGEDSWGTVGNVLYAYEGDGDLTEVKLGLGWEPFRNFSIGFAAKYFWGHISKSYASMVSNDYVGVGEYISVIGADEFSVSRFKFQVGVQWSIIANQKRMLTVGATYDFGGPLNPKVSKSVVINDILATEVIVEDKRGEMRLPHSVNMGVMYQDSKFSAGLDYEYQNWGGNNAFYTEETHSKMSIGYVDTHTIKAGFEYTPNRFDVRRYLRRVAYRIGARYGNHYQSFAGQNIKQYAITAGFGFPLRFMGATSIDVGFEVGGRGTLASVQTAEMPQRVGLIRQNYFKVSLGLSLFGEDYWFVRPKID